MKQDQAVKAANDGKELAQTLADVLREINVTVAHVVANDLATDLQTVATELQGAAEWDGTGTPPAYMVENPKYQPEFITQYIEKRNDDGSLVFVTETVTTDEELDPDTGDVITPASEEEVPIEPLTVAYDERIVRNPNYNANIAPYVFKSTTGIDVSSDGILAGTDQTVSQLLVYLQVSEALAEFAESTPTGFTETVTETIEGVVTL